MTAALLLFGALAYTAWVPEFVVRSGLDPVRTYVSELAAADQPYGVVFRAADLVAGLLLLAGACWGLQRSRRRSRGRWWSVTGWLGLALFGAATAADSRLPLSCAPTVDAACAAREDAGLVPFTHTAHAVSSSLAMAGALVAMIALTVAARRHGDRPLLARTGPPLVAVAVLATGWTLAAIAAFDAGHGVWGLGAGQRLQLLAVAVWLAVLARSEYTARDRVPDRRPLAATR